jgi:2-oxoglutarate dehydrogenase E2 component (dihydrolipoamide succinyltransferase)
MAANKLTEIVVPSLGESVTEATIGRWLKNQGDMVEMDQPLVELETDKVTLEVNAPVKGILKEIKSPKGTKVGVRTVIGIMEAGEMTSKAAAATTTKEKQQSQNEEDSGKKKASSSPQTDAPMTSFEPSPAARKMMNENNIQSDNLQGTGRAGRITKGDVLEVLEGQSVPSKPSQPKAGRTEERVKMTRLRQRIAERLKEAQNTAAMLTTFNEIDMTKIIEVRARYKDVFEKKHGIKLGFMSFFVKAAIQALKEIPSVNAEIQEEEIVYKNYYDIGVAVAAPQGLVVPVVRDADNLSFAEIERSIMKLSQKAKEGKLALEDLSGATFTITNGGVFGSLMSTPIINPPQSGILGMHKIEKRPVVVEDKIEIRDMMYVALTYDHRLIDGKEAVTFLVRIKECIENPERLLLSV